jgi:hypothetical protein
MGKLIYGIRENCRYDLSASGGKEKDMRKLQIKVAIIIFSFAFLQSQSKASGYYNWTEGDYNIPDLWGADADVLNTRNNVRVSMFNGAYVAQFNMFDNSKLTMYDGYINTLNIYPDATAIVRGGDIHYLWVDPASVGWVKLYAYDVRVSPLPDSHGYLALYGYWLADDSFFSIQLENGISTYPHIQIIPEPATLVLLGLGSFAIFRRRRSRHIHRWYCEF